MSLINKVAIVTGASSGIGAAIAEKFAEEGAKVTMVGRNQTKLANVAEQVEKKGAKPLVITGDVTNEDDCRRILSETINHFGKLDILVNNAGIGDGTCSILDENVMEKYDNIMTTNLRSAAFMTHLAAPYLIESKENIIDISSVAGKGIFRAPSFAYSVSKAGLDHFTRCIALELSSKGVRVNAINPGPVKSDIIANSGYDDATAKIAWEQLRQSTPLGRIGDAEEIADLAAFLASDKGRSMTGGTYVTDNGTLLKGGSF